MKDGYANSHSDSSLAYDPERQSPAFCGECRRPVEPPTSGVAVTTSSLWMRISLD